jgi:ATP-dependent RNA helicase DDX6/DHH1
VTNTRGLTFDDFHIKKDILKGLYKKGFDRPSPVQEAVIPIALAGKDVIYRAKNGTGKTASYIIPLLEKIDTTKPVIQALVLTPTRELSYQASKEIKDIGQYMNVESIVLTGGEPPHETFLRLKKTVHVIVGTPLKILSMISDIKFEKCEMLVMDEADKLLSQDFKSQVETLITYLPPSRQILLLSATFPQTTQQFLKTHTPTCERINMMEELTLKGLSQFYVYLEEKFKVHCIHTLLSSVFLAFSFLKNYGEQVVSLSSGSGFPSRGRSFGRNTAQNKPNHHLLQLGVAS